MFQWSAKNKYESKKHHKSNPKNGYNRIHEELPVEEPELKSLLETQLEILPQTSEEISKSLDENITIANGMALPETQLEIISQTSEENITIANGINLPETQLEIIPQTSKKISKSLDENIAISNNRNPKYTGISLEVVEFVKTALEIFFINCYISCDLMEICDHPELMIAPNENRDQLIVYNTQRNNCKMYQCTSKHDTEIIFIFLTFEETSFERKYYITSPFKYIFIYTTNTSHIFPCASVEITDALNETPIAVAKMLRRIDTSPLPEGLYGGRFTWIMVGTEEWFKVNQGSTNLYWSTNLDDNEYNRSMRMDFTYTRKSKGNFDFRIVSELTPKQFRIIAVALDRILIDFKVYLYNSNVQKGILRTENTTLKTAVLELENNPSFKLVPSYMGMDYGIFPTNYNTFICISEEDTSLVKFLFQWYTSGRYYITSPFHTKCMTIYSRIPCASPVDITDALKIGNITDVLFGLTTREDGQVFTTNDFNWYMDESEGSFVVSFHNKGIDGNLYWTVCERDENIQLRDKDPSKLRIKLFDLA